MNPRGYNMHLLGIAEIKERKRLQRAEAWRIRNEKVQAIKTAFRAAREKGPLTVGDIYAIRDTILSPGDYGRKAPRS